MKIVLRHNEWGIWGLGDAKYYSRKLERIHDNGISDTFNDIIQELLLVSRSAKDTKVFSYTTDTDKDDYNKCLWLLQVF